MCGTIVGECWKPDLLTRRNPLGADFQKPEWWMGWRQSSTMGAHDTSGGVG